MFLCFLKIRFLPLLFPFSLLFGHLLSDVVLSYMVVYVHDFINNVYMMERHLPTAFLCRALFSINSCVCTCLDDGCCAHVAIGDFLIIISVIGIFYLFFAFFGDIRNFYYFISIIENFGKLYTYKCKLTFKYVGSNILVSCHLDCFMVVMFT